MNTFNFQKVVVAGVAGTAAFTVIMLMAPVMGLPKMDMGNMLGTMNPVVALPYWMGWVMHFMIGTVLTGIYAAFFLTILPSNSWKRGLVWSLFPYVLAQVMVMPVMGMGFFSGGNFGALFGSLLTHLAYGAVAGLVYADG